MMFSLMVGHITRVLWSSTTFKPDAKHSSSCSAPAAGMKACLQLREQDSLDTVGNLWRGSLRELQVQEHQAFTSSSANEQNLADRLIVAEQKEPFFWSGCLTFACIANLLARTVVGMLLHVFWQQGGGCPKHALHELQISRGWLCKLVPQTAGLRWCQQDSVHPAICQIFPQANSWKGVCCGAVAHCRSARG